MGEAVEKTLAFEGPPRDLLLGWFQEYVRLISMHKGGPAKITSAMGDPDSPILTKCQVLRGAHDQVIAALREQGALRDDVETLQVIRLVGGVATVADQSEPTRPPSSLCSKSSPTGWSALRLGLREPLLTRPPPPLPPSTGTRRLSGRAVRR